jgi:hypothetical protein
MKDVFADILNLEGVNGVLLFSSGGEVVFQAFRSSLPEEPASREWWPLFIDSLGGIREADLVFDMGRIYVKRSEESYLMVLLSPSASIAMVRLNCDILLPSLGQYKSKGLRRLFKRK